MSIGAKFSWIPPKVRVYGLLFLLSMAFLALGYDLAHRNVAPLLTHFVNEIGIAGLIGFLLAISIDKLSRDEFRKLAEEERNVIKKDVFRYVYGYQIPQAIRSEIHARILGSPFVRKGVIMRYELTPIEDPGSHEWFVLTTFKMKYDIENLTPEDQTFPFIAAIDRSPCDAFASQTKFVSLSAKGCRVPLNWDEGQLKAKQTQTDSDFCLELPNEIVVLPKQPAREDLQRPEVENLTTIELETDTVRFLKGGHIDFIFTNHIYDLNLIIHADKRLKVSASTFEQNPLQTAEAHSPSSGTYNWRLQRPLLAYQSLKISWILEGSFTVAPQAK